MFSIYRSQKNIQNKQLDYKALYLEERRLKEQFQRKAQIAELKYRKLAQSINKKCIRCMNIDDKKTKEDKILQLKQFKNGFDLLNIGSMAHIPKSQKTGKSKIIQNFGVFGVPESMLIQPQHFQELIEGELIYTSNMPSITEEHSAKLAFPSGLAPKYYSGLEAKQKAIQIMSSSCSYAKSFIMSFESKSQQNENQCELRKLMNPQNRLYAICLAIQDFSLVPNWETSFIQSQKMVISEKQDLASAKVLSCEETDISYHGEKDCSVATSLRVYCIFSHYPFFQFFHQTLKAIVNTVKTQRLVIYRESGCALAEADSHFFLERVKQTYRQISQQIEGWQAKLTKQYELKLMNCQKLPLSMNPQACMHNFVQDWGFPIFNMFNLDTFIDVFTLVILEQKTVFVSDNPTILTFAVHLFTQLLIKPFKYPYPVVNLLPNESEYFGAMCPFVYGLLSTKKNIMANKFSETHPEVSFILLQKQGIQIISSDSKKSTLKKRSKVLRDQLATKFKQSTEKARRVSSLTFTEEEINFQKDKQGICSEILKQVYLYLSDFMNKVLPKPSQIQSIMQEVVKNIKPKQDAIELSLQKIKKNYESKTKDDFYKALFDTQVVITHLLK